MNYITEFKQIAVELIQPSDHHSENDYSPDEIEGIKRCFVLYVKFPKSRWPDIKKAESFTEEGNLMFEKLLIFAKKILAAFGG